MKLNKRTKIESACATDVGRYSMQSVRFEKGRAVATNGRILAVVHAEEGEHDVLPRLIPADALKLARKAAQGFEVEVRANGSIEAAGVKFPEVEGDFPTYQRVLPESKDARYVTLNPKLLRALLEAIAGTQDESVTFAIPADKHAPVILVTVESGNVGAIMPVSIDDDDTQARVSGAIQWART